MQTCRRHAKHTGLSDLLAITLPASFFLFSNLSLPFPSSCTMGDLPGCMLQRSALLCGWGCAVYPGLLLEQVVPPPGCTSAGAGSVSSKVPERRRRKKKIPLCSWRLLSEQQLLEDKSRFNYIFCGETVLKLPVGKQRNKFLWICQYASKCTRVSSREQERLNFCSESDHWCGLDTCVFQSMKL